MCRHLHFWNSLVGGITNGFTHATSRAYSTDTLTSINHLLMDGLLIHLIRSPFHTYSDDYIQYVFSLLLKLGKSLALLTRTSSTGATNESKRVGGLARRKESSPHALHVQICPLLHCELGMTVTLMKAYSSPLQKHFPPLLPSLTFKF